jgi:tRNA(fMet)-specific endonuclease VapC
VTATIVDSSAWVDFLRGDATAVSRVDDLLRGGRAAITGPIAAEVLSGARTRSEYELLKRRFRGVQWVPDAEMLWLRAAEHRFALARNGFEAGLIDLVIALAAFDARDGLLTRDRDFERIRTVIPIELDLF